MKAASPSEEVRSTESDAELAQKEAMKSLLSEIRELLSEKQFRRLWMWRADEMTEEEIAQTEGIRQQNVSKSIQAALKTICEHFRK